MTMITGWVNMQKGTAGFYTGGDIWPTEEEAKKRASQFTVGQFYIRFEHEPDSKRKRDMTKYYEKKDMAKREVEEWLRAKSKRKSKKGSS